MYIYNLIVKNIVPDPEFGYEPRDVGAFQSEDDAKALKSMLEVKTDLTMYEYIIEKVPIASAGVKFSDKIVKELGPYGCFVYDMICKVREEVFNNEQPEPLAD